ncbi:hypothetical protein E1I69_13440 [Bacillus timonensis]|uniref:HNH endonuclease n=1 Tax=Bacillus timonensis TaxID=1033734 RepID=A0A4S3PRJ1_9BACI|nr:hypothetical protein E1I69_13440 [Bacillus timonensis]
MEIWGQSNKDYRCDLSNILKTQNTKNFDHIIPLNLYRTNDAFQLLCVKCNKSKGDRYTLTRSVTAPFWNY